jgi:hypothetical protein
MEEQKHLTVLAAGTLETVKLMPGYDDAIKAMTARAQEEIHKSEEPKLEI